MVLGRAGTPFRAVIAALLTAVSGVTALPRTRAHRTKTRPEVGFHLGSGFLELAEFSGGGFPRFGGGREQVHDGTELAIQMLSLAW